MWFIFALLSAVFAGLQSFAQKVGAEKRFDTYLLSTVSVLISALLAFVLFITTSSAIYIPLSLYGLAVLSGVLYIAASIIRLESLQFIDAALFFPLYKVIGPVLVTVLGIFIFKDALTSQEYIGIILSCLVPLLLLSRKEHHRQKNLKLGLFLMVGCTILTAIVTGVNAFAVKTEGQLALPLIVIAYGSSFLLGTVLYARKHKYQMIWTSVTKQISSSFLSTALAVGVMQFISFYFLLLALVGSDLSVVYSINAHYIVIPVLLSVWFYKEHWNMQKACALVISVLALILLH